MSQQPSQKLSQKLSQKWWLVISPPANYNGGWSFVVKVDHLDESIKSIKQKIADQSGTKLDATNIILVSKFSHITKTCKDNNLLSDYALPHQLILNTPTQDRIDKEVSESNYMILELEPPKPPGVLDPQRRTLDSPNITKIVSNIAAESAAKLADCKNELARYKFGLTSALHQRDTYKATLRRAMTRIEELGGGPDTGRPAERKKGGGRRRKRKTHRIRKRRRRKRSRKNRKRRRSKRR